MENLKNQLWEAALKKLEVRAHSKAEIKQKLLDQFPENEPVINEVVGELERVHLLSDKKFAEQYLAHLIQKPIGRLKIILETRRRGLDPDLVSSLLIEMNYHEEAACKKALEEKEAHLGESDPRKRKMKLINFLRNRGFQDATIYRVL